jgi:hypothetical protein
VDGYGNVALREITADANPGYPCRVCLRDALVGEKVLLFSHSPFPQAHPYRTVGPIYVHAEPCAPAGELAALPEQLLRRLLSLRAYGKDAFMLDAAVVEGSEADAVIGRLFADPRISFLHVHNARPGCYAARIERSGPC